MIILGQKKYRVIMRLDRKPGQDNASFQIIAILNPDNSIETYDIDDIESIFKPRGTIFAPSFFNRTSVSSQIKTFADNNDCLEATAIISDKPELGKDSYNLSYDDEICPVAYFYDAAWCSNDYLLLHESIKKINDSLRVDDSFFPLDSIHSVIFEEVKVKVDDFLRPLSGKTISGRKSLTSTRKNYCAPISYQSSWSVSSRKVIPQLLSGSCTHEVDMMDEQQLKEWLRKKIVSFGSVDSYVVSNIISELSSPEYSMDNLEAQRISRSLHLINDSFLTNEEIKLIFESESYIGDMLRNELQKQKDDAKQELAQRIDEMVDSEKASLQKELELTRKEAMYALEDELDSLRDKSNKDIQKAKESLLLLEGEKKQLSQETEQLKLEKERIEEESLSAKKHLEEIQKNKATIIESIKLAIDFKPFNTNNSNVKAEYFLQETTKDTSSIYKQCAPFIVTVNTTQALVVPNVSYAYLAAHYVNNCKVKVITVEHGWFHYNDFVHQGLTEFWNEAFDNPSTNYILVLQNMNMIPPESGLQPVFDIINGNRLSLPGACDVGIPSNLRIMGTVLSSKKENSIGLPLSISDMSGWFFWGNPEDTLGIPVSKIFDDPQIGAGIDFSKMPKLNKANNANVELYEKY